PICYDRTHYVVAQALARARTRPAQALLLSSLASANLFKTDPLPVLVAYAKGPDLEFRLQALRAIATAGEYATFGNDAVLAGLADPDRRVQAVAASAFRYRYEGAPAAMVAPLGKLLETADQESRRLVLDGLHNVKDPAPALEGLLAVLADPEADVHSK